MDTSETYIKMCEKSRKFLHQWKPQEGDWFICGNWSLVYVWTVGNKLVQGAEKNEDCFPLYRQDQLQEMVGQDWNWIWLARNLWGFARHNFRLHSSQDREGYYPSAWEPTSMEQLWLGFVMKEKYNKVWNGEDWI